MFCALENPKARDTVIQTVVVRSCVHPFASLIGCVTAYAGFIKIIFFSERAFTLKFNLNQETMPHVYEIKSPVGLVTRSVLNAYNARASTLG